MNQVKETLGRDAIILHTRKFRKGGIGGFFGREMIEVMAAVDNDIPPVTLSPNAKPKAKVAKNRPSTGSPVRSLIKTPPAKAPEPVIEPVSENKPAIEPMELVKLNTADTSDVKDHLSLVENKAVEVKNDEDLKSEITGIRNVLEELLAKTKTTPTNPWYDYLIKRELLPLFADQILKGFPYALTMLNKNPEATKNMIRDRLTPYIRSIDGIKFDENSCKKIALIGPTGVGKTTTLAKLAAKFTLEKGAKVAFITSDTYRIAAVEQLRTYANILNIPLDVVYSSEEMKKAIYKHQDKNIIFIDTAGRSQHNDEQINELKDLFVNDDSIETHLVMSSTTKHQDNVDVIEKFAVKNIESLIFTKIDEARNIGNIFNIMYQFPEIGISYVTNGQNVPDDIHTARAEYLTDRLLRD